MNKKDILYLHALLTKVREVLEAEEVECETLEIYDKLDIKPGHIHKSKNEHEIAVLFLARGIAELINRKCLYIDEIDKDIIHP